MKQLLLATAAVIALGVMAPFAEAQYGETVTSPTYQTQVPATTGTSPDPMAAHTHSRTTPSTTTTMTTTTTQVDPYNTQTQVQTTTQADPYAAQTTTQADPYAAQAHTTTHTDVYATENSAYGTQSYYDASASAQTRPVDLAETAQLAGMSGVPMTPADVCAPREVALGGRLDVRARRQLVVATDHASVCEMQRVVVHSPSGRADAVRRTLVDHGVDERLIEVQTGNELSVEMNFAGVAASTPEYAAMFNAMATSYASSGQPGAMSMNQPSAHQATSSTPGVESVAYEPVESAAPTEPQTWRPVETNTSASAYQSTTTTQTTTYPADASAGVSQSTTTTYGSVPTSTPTEEDMEPPITGGTY